MGDFAADIELTPTGDGTFTRMLHRGWEIWGPNGGYMGALALQAAASCGRARPANATVHFLGVANFDEPVTLRATTQRATRVATSVRVSVAQAERPILEAMVWAVDDDLAGLRYSHGAAPDVAHWSDLPTIAERLAAAGVEDTGRHRFWDNFDQRPARWIADWENRRDEPPVYQNWLRFRPDTASHDPWVEAGRLLLLVDLGAWPAASVADVRNAFVAPSIDVSCEFHRLRADSPWYLLAAESPHAGDGLVGSYQQVWSEAGELLASGISHLLCRPLP